ncbi:peptidase family M3 [Leptospira broomii serovar Hurstbridge str. 5399]|uniref:oligopeptidase A n=2 Tax=Leptospira broomii TaxID=301541 RepID=T0GJ58_9LEPT|nr:peptidase family M3 [Leptospira broomii serovar Hurstbridge str. 5399]
MRALDGIGIDDSSFVKMIPQKRMRLFEVLRILFLMDKTLPFREFPNVPLENLKDSIRAKISFSKELLSRLLVQDSPTYDSLIRPLNDALQDLHLDFTVLSHLNSVKNNEESKSNYTEILPEVTEFYSDLGQNEQLFQAYTTIFNREKNSLSQPQKKVLEDGILQFKLGGVGLPPERKKRLQEIQLRLSDVDNQFSQNLLDATNAYEMRIESEEDVKEIPESDKTLYRNSDGSYSFTLQFPSYISYMTYGTNRNKREELYKAYVTKAPQNGKLIQEILALRDEEALLLGYSNFAELSLATKVADSPKTVLNFLEELGKKAKPFAEKEFKELSEFAKTLGIDDLQAFDTAYVSEKLKKQSYDFDEEETRPYFEKNSVVKGAFEFFRKLFGFELIKTDAPTWDSKVEVYQLKSESQIRAQLYLDLESRKDKQSGAWMNNWASRNRLPQGVALPTAFVVCNFPPSKEGSPSLLKHSDVVTLFHEMGHTLHHICTKVEEPPVSGINGVEWDAVEFPSQFLENFAYEPQVLQFFAFHYQTKEPMPQVLVHKLKATKNFLAGLGVLRQLEFGIFDMRIHMGKHTENEVQRILDEVRKEVGILQPPSYNKFQNGFSHIFSGGYAAGYYSYKWAELLAADAFFAFLEKGIFDAPLAESYKNNILEKGGSENAMNLFRKFLGRDPSPEALLRLYDLVA